MPRARTNLEDVVFEGQGRRARCPKLRPYGIIHWKGQWYLCRLRHLRQEIRNFRVDRIIGLELTEHVFERPADFSAKDVLLGSLLPDSGDHEPLIHVVIQGHEHVLNELSQHWLFGHTLVKRRDGEAHFQLDTSSLMSYVPYFLLLTARL